jgi:branched-chain amino acid transport system permease protein
MSRTFNRSQLVLLAGLLAAGAAQFFSNRLDSYVLSVAMGVGINIVLASSLNLINGFTGQFSLGHAGFMAVGAYTSAVLTTVFGDRFSALFGGHVALLFPVALVAGGLAAAFAGVLVGAPSLRLKGDYLAIVTLGFGEIIKVILQNLDIVGRAKGLNGIPEYSNLFWVFGAAMVTVYTVWALMNSSYGRGFLAVADDEIAAESMGLNTTRYKIVAFLVGSFFAGIAGGLFAHLNNSINPSGFDFNKSIEIVVMVILGGMGRHVGVVLAAILLTILTELLRQFGDYRMVIYALLLILLMLTRPQGLFFWPKRKAAGSQTV